MAMAAPSAEAPRGRKRGAEGPPALPHEEVQDQARAWTEVFTLFQQSGRDDRGAAFAMSMGALRRRGEEIDSIDRQIEALRFAAGRLQQHARCEAAGPGGAPSVTPQAQAWGRALAGSAGSRRGGGRGAAVARRRAGRRGARGGAAPAGRQAGGGGRGRRPGRGGVRRRGAGEGGSLDRAQRDVLRSRGLNARRLPLRPGLPPCGRFVRKGVCRAGRGCRWDHPETDVNSKGHPLRPGQKACAAYRRTQCCKFGALCAFDHPEPSKALEDLPGTLPLALARAAAQQQQSQLLLHLQLLQELGSLQDPEAMKNAWMRFRYTFSLNL
ncbi:unnamed protein product [Prorocentrum cordatum]|uniref:C3H1-type domain-containing protein n=1 Tax=Prorocentrum cordatum TaxID=2364126 RepID=A0ABN9W5P9_9DINO|nr:unnamed protein product [Polarella glacialis]